MIVIIDYNMGNVGAIANMLKKIGSEVKISSYVDDLLKAEKLVLPGVGSFDSGMKNLTDSGLIPVLNEQVLSYKKPILGICLGMQLMTKSSEEGKLSGLGYIDGKTVKFNLIENNSRLKIPHMGWNLIDKEKDSPLFLDLYEENRFYFVHSYHVVCKNQEDILTTTSYGHKFVSSFQKANIIGVQFHPEKSHKFGMKLLKNFVEI